MYRVGNTGRGLALGVALAMAWAGGTHVAASSKVVQEQTTGVVTGRVVDSNRGEPLPGALVRVDGTVIWRRPIGRARFA